MLSLLLAAMLAVPGWAEPARFTADSNGTVLDTRTGLMWQKTDSYHDMKKRYELVQSPGICRQ